MILISTTFVCLLLTSMNQKVNFDIFDSLLLKVMFITVIVLIIICILIFINVRRDNKKKESSNTNVQENNREANSHKKQEDKSRASDQGQGGNLTNSNIPEINISTEDVFSNEIHFSSDDNDTTDTNKFIDDTQKDSNISMLTVKNGQLKVVESGNVIYYKCWIKNGKKYFEFVNNDRTKKAINNRSILIEPFCFKLEQSISPDVSDMVETIEPGILSEDNIVIVKAKIKYK